MLKSLFRGWLAKLERSEIGDGRGDVFFVRYKVLKCRWFSVFLHEFHRSDYDRCLHDHPWWFVTLILRGGYWEVLPDIWKYDAGDAIPHATVYTTRKVWRRPGYIGRYSAAHAHRIEVDPSRPRPWSLVVVGPKTRPWGFWGPLGWVKWRPSVPNPICETPGP